MINNLTTISYFDKLINRLMIDGKKTIAESIISETKFILQEKTSKNPDETIIQAINIAKPSVEIKSIRIAGSTYMVPVELQEKRQLSLALKWIVQSARSRKERGMASKLAFEIIDILKKNGNTIKKKEELHKMAEANRAFAHYRW